MANTIFSNNKPVHHPSRTAHDLSSTHAFSMRPAVLRPVVYQDTVPNSAFRINCTDLVRTSALQTAAFLRGKQELDFFFVPYQLLYSRANDIVFQRSDIHSPLQNTLTQRFPSVLLSELITFAYWAYMFAYCCNNYDYLKEKYGSADLFRVFSSLMPSNGFSNVTENSLLNCLTYNTVSDSQIVYILDNGDYSSLDYVGSDIFALLDSAGYGNYLAYLDPMISHLLEDDYDSIELFVQDVTDAYFSDVIELCTSSVSLIRLFAYQKIFCDRYRDTIIDNSDSYSFAVSMDLPSGQSLIVKSLSSINCTYLTWLRPRCRGYKKDILTGCYPSPQLGSVSSVADVSSSVYDDLNLPGNSRNQNSAIAIRTALAMQKYKETLLRAGSKTKDLLKSEFGVESNYIQDTYVRYLGSFSGQLELNKVSATAETGSYSVGDLAGNVFSSLHGDTIEFTCNDYGVIVGVISFFPEVLNNSFGISPFNYKTDPLDFFHDAFDDLGLQPVSSHYASAFRQTLLNPTTYALQFNPEVLGYSARYNEYKQNLDVAHDKFCTHNLSFHEVKSIDGFNSNYVIVRPIEQALTNVVNRNYMLPSVMDSIFVAQDNGTFETYHFDVILDCSINAILPMSNLGLPNM